MKKSFSYILSSILISSSIFSCNNINKIDNIENYKIGNGNGIVKVNLNLKPKNSNFKVKASENGFPEKTRSDLTKITIRVSTDQNDPYNNYTGTELNISVALTNTFHNLTISGLDPNKTYYLSAKAFQGATNITEGGVAISNEYVQTQIDSSVAILNDNVNNIWDITLNLLDGQGASINSEVNIENGTKGDFDLKEEKVNTDGLTTNQYLPSVSINELGNGLIAYETVDATGVENIVGRFISDYNLDAKEFLLESNAINNSSRSIKQPSITINNKGNGLLIWKQKDNTSEIMRYRKIENYKPTGSEFDLDTSEVKQKYSPTIGFQKKISGTQRSAIVIWRKEADLSPNFDLKAKIFRTSNNDFSNTLNLSPEIKINFGTNERNAYSPKVSQIGDQNKCMVVWTKNDGIFDRVYTKVLSLDNNATPDFLTAPSSQSDVIISQDINHKGLNPSISLNDKGDGLIVWEEGTSTKKVYYKRVTNYGFNNLSSAAVGFRVTDFNSTQTNPKVSLDDNGNGLVIWKDLRSFPDKIYAKKIIGYQPVGSDFRLSSSTVYELQSDLDLNSNLNGVAVWEKSDDGSSDFDIYSRRILNNNAE